MTREQIIKNLEYLIQFLPGKSIYAEKTLTCAIAALRGPVPNPETGLVPCGCGGIPYPHFELGWYREDTGLQGFEVRIGCDNCGLSTKPRYGRYFNGEDIDKTEIKSKADWNRALGYKEDA